MRRMLLAVLLLAAAGALFLLRPRDRAPRDVDAKGSASAAAPVGARDTELASSEAPRARAEAAVAGSAEPKPLVAGDPEPSQSPALHLVGGRILDLHGQPIASASVGIKDRADLEPAVSAADGGFELAVPADMLARKVMLTTRGETLVAVAESIVDQGTLDHEHLIVAAENVRLEGRVTDPSGAALAGARVEVQVGGWLTMFPLPLDRAERHEFGVQTDSHGRFTLQPAPSFSSGELVASKAGYEPTAIDVPDASASDLVLVLEPSADQRKLVIEGVVLLPDRAPAPGARVRLGRLAKQTDGEGRFALEVQMGEMLPFDGDDALAAALVGYGPAILERFGAFVNEPAPSSPPPVELVLGSELRLAGRVLDPAGAPAVGWHVSLLDGHALTRWSIPVVTLENLAVGPTRDAITTADGSFEIGGLTARDYRLQAWDPRTLVRIEHGPVPAGSTGLVLRAAPDALLPRVAGKLITRAGRPVPKAEVCVALASSRTENGYSCEKGATVWTDDEGRFELTAVPRDPGGRIYLRLDSDDILPDTYWFDDDQPVEGLVLSVAARCRYRVENEVPEEEQAEGLWLTLLDAEGVALSLYELEGRAWNSMPRQLLVSGSNGIRSVSEDARTLRVMTSEDEVFLERPISLVPGAVTPIGIP